LAITLPEPLQLNMNRLARGDVHREVLAEFFISTLVIEEHADLAAVQVTRKPAPGGHANEAAHADVFADLRDQATPCGFDRLTVAP
jgi:hypothetical protein